jgi:hypothetical protein
VALTHARWSIVGTEPGSEAVKLAGQGSIVSRRQPDATSLN